jgi:predicted phosphodiesterase
MTTHHVAPEAWIPDVLRECGVGEVATWTHPECQKRAPNRSKNGGRMLHAAARVVHAMQRRGDLGGATSDPTAEPDVETRETADGMSLRYDGRVTSLDELLDRARVDRSEWAVGRYEVGTYEVTMRGPGDRPVTVPMWRVRATLQRRPDADLPDLSTLPAAPRATSASVDPGACLHIPDSQHGYVRREDGTLAPLHDPRAWAVAVEAARQLQPAIIHLCGDMLDLAAWSMTYPRARQHVDTTGHTLTTLHGDIRALREAVPGARIVYTSGNHEHRIDRALVASMGELAGLHAVGDDAPLVSVPRLLALDRLDVEWHPYESDVWIGGADRQRVRLTHGAKHGRPGQTVARYLADVSMGGDCTVVGHTHSAEVAYQRIVGPDGERVVYAMSPGTLADIAGDIPAAIAPQRRTWTQGLGVTRWDDAGRAHGAVYPLVDGRCIIEGRVVRA